MSLYSSKAERKLRRAAWVQKQHKRNRLAKSRTKVHETNPETDPAIRDGLLDSALDVLDAICEGEDTIDFFAISERLKADQDYVHLMAYYRMRTTP